MISWRLPTWFNNLILRFSSLSRMSFCLDQKIWIYLKCYRHPSEVFYLSVYPFQDMFCIFQYEIWKAEKNKLHEDKDCFVHHHVSRAYICAWYIVRTLCWICGMNKWRGKRVAVFYQLPLISDCFYSVNETRKVPLPFFGSGLSKFQFFWIIFTHTILFSFHPWLCAPFQFFSCNADVWTYQRTPCVASSLSLGS